MTIFEIVQAQSIASYWNELKQDRPPFLGETLFPNKKKLGLDLKWIKGSKGLPVELKLSSFDAKTMIRDRIGFGEMSTEMPFFKEGAYIDERLRQELNKVLESKNPEYIDAIVNQIFDTERGLVESASVSRERMRMQLLSTGVINIASNGQEYTYDFGVPAANKHTLTGNAQWSNLQNANPIEDIIAWAQDVEDRTGVKPTRALMTRKTFNYIAKNEKLAKSIYITNNGVGIVTDAMVIDAIKTLAGVTVVIYNKRYANANGTATQYFPDDVVSLFPEGDLGNTWFGTTPEESDLMAASVANVSIVDTGVAITTTKETDPVNVFTKVTQISLPSFEQADKVVISTVA